jgi:hypothetical protein
MTKILRTIALRDFANFSGLLSFTQSKFESVSSGRTLRVLSNLIASLVALSASE